MNRTLFFILLVVSLLNHQCGVIKEIQKPSEPVVTGMKGFTSGCVALDTIESVLISKADALLMFDDERYEVTITLYAKKDSIIYLSAVNSGYEIIRASVEGDSIKVINRLNKIVYKAPLQRRFGYQYPVNFSDLQNLVTHYYLCDDIHLGFDDMEHRIQFIFDDNLVNKRISLDRVSMRMNLFEFRHTKTGKYLMGERNDDGFRIYSNFTITEFEIITSGGTVMYNQEIKVKMDVNPRRYTFTELR